MKQAWIGLGSNLGDPPSQLAMALKHIGALGELSAVSSYYRSKPMGPADQPDYCNAVCALTTALSPEAVLGELLSIERRLGRIRNLRWGPRLIDLDLLHVDGEQRDVPGLQLPHPGIGQRNFVLVPLAELDPDLVIPTVGRVGDAAARLGTAGLQRWSADPSS